MIESTEKATMQPKVLVVEDDPDLRAAMVSYLNCENVSADGVATLAAAQTWVRSHEWDVIVLDLGLPDGDGLNWLGQIQASPKKGVIVMTARGKTEQRIAGMKAGADAYLVKPVALEELVLHIRKLHQRLVSATPSKPVWQLHRKRWLLTSPDGRVASLSQSETRLLAALGEASGNAVPKMNLIRELGFDPMTYDDRRLEGLVRRVRLKCVDELGQAIPLQTAYGFGYAFTETLEILN